MIAQFNKILSDYGAKHALVHTDIVRAFGFAEYDKDLNTWFNNHFSNLKKASEGVELIFPTFNYDFLKTGIYHLDNDSVQVGALNEHIRKNFSCWRSLMPVYNVCGTSEKTFNENFTNNSIINPFGEESIFEYLYKNNGAIIQYGAPLPAITALHYIESKSQPPIYRYDKFFSGKIIGNSLGKEINIQLKYHVRPQGVKIEYSWDKLYKLFIDSQVLNEIKERKVTLRFFNFKNLVTLLDNEIKQDPLYLLTEESKASVQPLLDKLGRRFIQADFENTHD